MKTSSLWAGIIGAVVIICALFGIVGRLSGHIELPLVTGVEVFQGVLAIALGAYLISFFLKGRAHVDKEPVSLVEADSAEDIERLKKNRRIVIAFVFLASAAGSCDFWLLNNYSAGLTPVNIYVVFDVVCNLVLIVWSFLLLRGREGSLKALFYFTVVYSVVEALLAVWRGFWFAGLSCVVFLVYLAFTVFRPISRKNFRIANFIILPVTLLLFFACSSLDGISFNNTLRQESLLEQKYSDSVATVSGRYQLFLQHEVPTKHDIQDVEDALKERNDSSQSLEMKLHELGDIYSGYLPSAATLRNVEHLRKLDVLFAAEQAQADKLAEFMKFAETLNFNSLTQGQQDKLSAYKSAIDDLAKPITEAQFELTNEVK